MHSFLRQNITAEPLLTAEDQGTTCLAAFQEPNGVASSGFQRRVEQLANSYLNGSTFFTQSGSLRGPFEGPWRNPWASQKVSNVCSDRQSQGNVRQTGYSLDESTINSHNEINAETYSPLLKSDIVSRRPEGAIAPYSPKSQTQVPAAVSQIEAAKATDSARCSRKHAMVMKRMFPEGVEKVLYNFLATHGPGILALMGKEIVPCSWVLDRISLRTAAASNKSAKSQKNSRPKKKTKSTSRPRNLPRSRNGAKQTMEPVGKVQKIKMTAKGAGGRKKDRGELRERQVLKTQETRTIKPGIDGEVLQEKSDNVRKESTSSNSKLSSSLHESTQLENEFQSLLYEFGDNSKIHDFKDHPHSINPFAKVKGQKYQINSRRATTEHARDDAPIDTTTVDVKQKKKTTGSTHQEQHVIHVEGSAHKKKENLFGGQTLIKDRQSLPMENETFTNSTLESQPLNFRAATPKVYEKPQEKGINSWSQEVTRTRRTPQLQGNQFTENGMPDFDAIEAFASGILADHYSGELTDQSEN